MFERIRNVILVHEPALPYIHLAIDIPRRRAYYHPLSALSVFEFFGHDVDKACPPYERIARAL